MEGDECTTVEIARLYPKKFEIGYISYIFGDLRDIQRWPGTKTAWHVADSSEIPTWIVEESDKKSLLYMKN